MSVAAIYIMIYDDDTTFVDKFKDLIIRIYQQKGIVVNVVCIMSVEELFYELEVNGRPDALFIDIELGDENGIDIVSKIREKDRYLDIVFVSSYDRYCYDAFKQRPLAFLRKPINEKECQDVLDNIFYERCVENRVFKIKAGSRIVNEKYSDILYVESDKRYVTFFCADGREHKMRGTLNNIEKELKSADVLFLRIHQSILVNLRHIHIYDYEQVVLSNDVVLPIAFERRKDVRKIYFDFCFKEKK